MVISNPEWRERSERRRTSVVRSHDLDGGDLEELSDQLFDFCARHRSSVTIIMFEHKDILMCSWHQDIPVLRSGNLESYHRIWDHLGTVEDHQSQKTEIDAHIPGADVAHAANHLCCGSTQGCFQVLF